MNALSCLQSRAMALSEIKNLSSSLMPNLNTCTILMVICPLIFNGGYQTLPLSVDS